ncbi:hypothetical protein CSUI_007035 [Cystoisospora suis]|uniref:Uncharacterized protein n=1 Tax=Cystoisospora suis TaxID=483139 RepID=A0A2C6KS03_9APIC|nr:hypothetical protein CSUI_007035 [Cystoisospora suis]
MERAIGSFFFHLLCGESQESFGREFGVGPTSAREKVKPPAVPTSASSTWQYFTQYSSASSVVGKHHRCQSKSPRKPDDKDPIRTGRSHSILKPCSHSPPGFLVNSVRGFAREKEWGEDELSHVAICPAGAEDDSESDGPPSVIYFPLKEFLVRPPPREERWFRFNMCLQGEDFDSLRFRRFPFHEGVEQFILPLLNLSLSEDGSQQGAHCRWHLSSSVHDVPHGWASEDRHGRCQSPGQSPEPQPSFLRAPPPEENLPSHSSSHGPDFTRVLTSIKERPVNSSKHSGNLYLDISTRVRDPDDTTYPSTPTEAKGPALWIADEDDLGAT